MCSKKRNRIFRSVTARLTLWYLVLFGGLSGLAFLLSYLFLVSTLQGHVDEQLSDDVREFGTLYRQHGLAALQDEFQREAESEGNNRIFFKLISPDGALLAASDLSTWGRYKPRLTLPEKTGSNRASLETTSYEGRGHHHVRTVLARIPGGDFFQIGISLHENEETLERFGRAFWIILSLMILFGGIGGWMIARRAMSGVERVTQTAVHIGKAGLARRVPLGKEGREIENLARAFNDMLERIRVLIGELKEVSDNIAHDLRSPVTRIRGTAETTLTGAQHIDNYRDMAVVVVDECDSLVEMINTMLEISQTDSGAEEISRYPVDMRKIIEDAYELFLPFAQDKGVRFESDLQDSPLTVIGDESRLQRVVANILDNAIKYTPARGSVRVEANAGDSELRIIITDTGIGISRTELSNIFNRFYRAEKSRSSPGNGLGLSLARAIIQAHGGYITVSSSPGKGSTFTVVLPTHLIS